MESGFCNTQITKELRLTPARSHMLEILPWTVETAISSSPAIAFASNPRNKNRKISRSLRSNEIVSSAIRHVVAQPLS